MFPGKLLLPFTVIVSIISMVHGRQCYLNNGEVASSTYQPCNPDESVHSSCCNLGASPNVTFDVCLGTGLCFWTDGISSQNFLFANGCTDPTGQDPHCQQICKGQWLLQKHINVERVAKRRPARRTRCRHLYSTPVYRWLFLLHRCSEADQLLR